MSQSLAKMYVHAIFHVKNNECLIRPEDEKELYAYLGSVVKLSKSIPIIINGIDNHIHVLGIMSKKHFACRFHGRNKIELQQMD